MDDTITLRLDTPYCKVTNNGKIYKGTIREYLKANKNKKINIIIPNEIDGKKATTIPKHFLNNFKNIITVEIEDGIKSIGALAFNNCKNLEYVKIPNSVSDIGYSSFDGTIFRMKLYPKPNEITILGDNILFLVNAWNPKIDLPKDVKHIGAYAFIEARVDNIELNDNISDIGTGAFYKCKSLKSIILPKNIEKICDSTFLGCESLENIIIPDNVKKISTTAFALCKSLKEVVIPKNIEEISKYAFSRCNDITIIYKGTKEEFEKIVNGNINKYFNDVNINFVATADIDKIIDEIIRNKKWSNNILNILDSEEKKKYFLNAYKKKIDCINDLNDKLIYLSIKDAFDKKETTFIECIER